MQISTFLRHLREGFKNIGRNGWMSFASLSSMAVSLFILGAFLLLVLNVNRVADYFDNQVQINVYVKMGVSAKKTEQLTEQIKAIPEVKSVTFISKTEGLKRYRDSMGKDGKQALQGFEKENPLPDAYEIEATDPQKVAQVAQKVKALNKNYESKPISTVKYGAGTVEKLFKITNLVRNLGGAFVLVLAFVAIFLVSTTIKMTIFSRRKEIEIMKLVGATNHFIRWPFFIEGATLGILGSLLSILILFTGYAKIIGSASFQLGMTHMQFISVDEMKVYVGGLILFLGTILGVMGSLISVRKHLKV